MRARSTRVARCPRMRSLARTPHRGSNPFQHLAALLPPRPFGLFRRVGGRTTRMACRRTRAISARFRGGRATRRMHMNLLLWKWTRLRTRPTRMVVLPAAVAAVAAAIAALCAAAILAAHPGCWTLLRSAPAILPRELSTMMVLTPVLTWCVLLSTRGPFTMVPRVADATRPHHASRSYHAWHAHAVLAHVPRVAASCTPWPRCLA